MKQIIIEVPQETYDKLQKKAKEKGVTVAWEILQILQNHE